MKKIYTIFSLMIFSSFLFVEAQNQQKKSLDIESSQTNFDLKTETAHLASVPNVVEHDSTVIYSSTGNITAKQYFSYEDEGRDITMTQYTIVDSTNISALVLIQRTAYDKKGNLIFNMQLENPDAIYGVGNKSSFVFNDNEMIESSYYRWNPVKKDWLLVQHNKKDISSEGYQLQLESYRYDDRGNMYDASRTISFSDLTNLIKKEYFYIWNSIMKDWVDFEVVPPSAGDSTAIRNLGYNEYAYTFNTNNRVEARITNKIYKNSGLVVPERKDEYIYNTEGLLKERIAYYMEDFTNSKKWIYSTRDLYEYDTRGNQTLSEAYFWDESTVKWNKINKIESAFDDKNVQTFRKEYTSNPEGNIWIPIRKRILNLDSEYRRLLEETYICQTDSMNNEVWIGEYRYISKYTNDWRTYNETQRWSTTENNWTLFSKDLTELDSNGNQSVFKSYRWIDGEWATNYIKIFYPYAPIQDIDVEETKPINNEADKDNYSGKFTLTLNIASDAVPSGSFDILLPEGFKLDLNATRLSSELSSKAQASFTEKGNNVWVVTISPTTLRSSNDLVYKNILDIAYTVSENVAVLKHEIVLKDIALVLSTGGVISKDELKIAVAPKNISGLEESVQSINVYQTAALLNIYSPSSEEITVFSLQGQALLKTTKQDGLLSVDSQSLPKGILIINGNSGWNRKLLIK